MCSIWKVPDNIADHIWTRIDNYERRIEHALTGWIVGVEGFNPWISGMSVDAADAFAWDIRRMVSRTHQYVSGKALFQRKLQTAGFDWPDNRIVMACITQDMVPEPWRRWGFTHRDYAHFIEWTLHCCISDDSSFIPTKGFKDQDPKAATAIYIVVQLPDIDDLPEFPRTGGPILD